MPSLITMERILNQVGRQIDHPANIFALGGFCMLLKKARLSTNDIDYIPEDREFVVPIEFKDILNSDILNLGILNLDWKLILPYSENVLQYGKLSVYIASNEFLLATKIISRQHRLQQRDLNDVVFLSKIADWEKAYEVYKTIYLGDIDSYEDLKAWLESEVWIGEKEHAFSPIRVFT